MTYGNLAYKYDYIQRKTNRRTAKQNIAINKSKKVKPISYAAKIAAVMIVAVSAIFMITQFVEVNDTLSALQTAQEQYDFEESVTSQKSFELEQSIDLSKIEQEATNRLGMHRPEQHQVVYIDVPQDDVTEKTAGEVEGFKNRFSAAVRSIISNIIDRFSI